MAFCILVLLALINLFQVELIRTALILGVKSQVVTSNLISAQARPMDLGNLDQTGNGALKASFEFRINDTKADQNLFQTADFNEGLRAELSDDAVHLVFPKTGAPGKLQQASIGKNIIPGQWFRLKMEWIKGSFINCEISDISGSPSYHFRTWGTKPDFSLQNVRIGTGYDESRRFTGDIRNVTVFVMKSREPWAGLFAVESLKILLFATFVIVVYFFFVESHTQPPIVHQKRTAHYDPLLTLRAVACLLVVAGHGLTITHRPANLVDDVSRPGSLVWLVTASPWGGVWIFFTLSGYLMGKGFYYGRYAPDRAGVVGFYHNRLLRIVPLYWISVFIVSALLHPEIFRWQYISILGQILFFDYDGLQLINPIGALWSVSTEMSFYMMVPFIYIIFARRITSPGLVIGVLLTLLGAGLAFRLGTLNTLGWDFWSREVFKTLVGNIDLFLCGFFTNYLVRWLQQHLGTINLGTEAGFILLVVVYMGLSYISAKGMILAVSLHDEWRGFLFKVVPTLTALSTSAIIILFELGRKDSPNLLAKFGKRMEILGLLTYAIYVWHEPILLASAAHQPPLMTLSAAFLSWTASLIVVLAMAYLMYYLIELPFERRKTYGPVIIAGKLSDHPEPVEPVRTS